MYKVFILGFLLLFFPPDFSRAERASFGGKKQVISEMQGYAQSEELRFNLTQNTEITIINNSGYANLTDEVYRQVNNLYKSYQKHFDTIPDFTNTIYLLDEESFFASTGAPTWTNAIFYDQKIYLPVVTNNTEEVLRTIRHEFSHAIIEALSGGKCPGWLDEGIAQWSEGLEHEEIRYILSDWLKQNQPISLTKLQHGFTKLDENMVAPAYAQSLYASKLLVRASSKENFRNYFLNLRENSNQNISFSYSFGFSESEFGEVLEDVLNKKFQS